MTISLYSYISAHASEQKSHGRPASVNNPFCNSHPASHLCYNVSTMNLYDTLIKYTASDAYPFHMPGHKRRAEGMCDPLRIDITEIDGFDNLHHAEGILLEAQERAAKLWKSSETHFLVNGSTAGILSAIGACTRPGATILMARNSHRSAYNAAALNYTKTAYLYPKMLPSGLCGPIDPAQAEAELIRLNGDGAAVPLNGDGAAAPLQPNGDGAVCAVFITSPTYDGVVSDVRKIAEIAHRHNAVLIVDEAHGAHFGMHDIFPGSSVAAGADIVIHSLHKTLPSLTQTALIHVNGPRVDRQRLSRLLSVYQTSSPSYVLMASIDRCVNLLTEKGDELFHTYAKRLDHFYQNTKLSHLVLLKTDDPSRILIHPGDTGITAIELYQTLIERYHLQPEMVTPSYVLMLSSVCDDDEGFFRLSAALCELDAKASANGSGNLSKDSLHTDLPLEYGLQKDRSLSISETIRPKVLCTIAQALDSKHEAIPFASSDGHISAEFLTLYPPGIPLLVPGEEISAKLITDVLDLKRRGYAVQGPVDHSLSKILTVRM